jgi:hypothetical protein
VNAIPAYGKMPRRVGVIPLYKPIKPYEAMNDGFLDEKESMIV